MYKAVFQTESFLPSACKVNKRLLRLVALSRPEQNTHTTTCVCVEACSFYECSAALTLYTHAVVSVSVQSHAILIAFNPILRADWHALAAKITLCKNVLPAGPAGAI